MSIQTHIALAGMEGLAGVMMIVGYLFYDKNSDIASVLLFVGVVLAIVIVIVELYIRYMDADSRRKESEAKADYAPFTYGC